MRFPLSTLDIHLHYDRIYDLINDPNTTIFLDTNIIAQIYKLNNRSREEFINWLEPLAKAQRLKIPNWVVSEYSNRVIRDQTGDYLSQLTTLKRIDKEYSNIHDFLKLHIDDDVIRQSSDKYSTVEELDKDISAIKDLLSKIRFLAKTKDTDFKHRIQALIENLLNKCHLQSDLDSVLKEVGASFQIRYDHQLPPGFKDGSKLLNECGDLIIWKEILQYCGEHQKTQSVILTDDGKKDWVYAPIKVIENGRTVTNQKEQYKVIDPRLVHEFFIRTGSQDIEIVSIETLISILASKTGSFTDFARSLQLSNDAASPTAESDDVTEETNELPSIDKMIDEEAVATESGGSAGEIRDPEEPYNRTSTTIRCEESSEDMTTNALFQLNETAYKDRYIDLSSTDLLTKTIASLKSYNWYAQNPALDLFLRQIKKYDFDESEEEQSKLFVVGRNIYQAAYGGSNAARVLIHYTLPLFIQNNSDYVVNLIYAGMLYEVYFDSEGRFRGKRLKSGLIDELLSMESNPKLAKAQIFIKAQLRDYQDKLIYIPFSCEDITIVARIKPDPEEVLIKELQIKELYNVLYRLEYKIFQLLTDSIDNGIQHYRSALSRADLENLICETYGIPKNRLQVDFIGFNSSYKIAFKNLYLKKEWWRD